MTTRLLVEGLDWAIGDADLAEAFSAFGEVALAKIGRDWETGRSRGFGHVTFHQVDDALRALEGMDGKRLRGKVLRVMEAPEAAAKTTYRGGDFGYTNDEPAKEGTFRNADFDDARKAKKDRRIYRSADYGYADGATADSTYRSADFDGGGRKKVTKPSVPPATAAEPDADAGDGPAADDGAEATAGAAEETPRKGPKRGGGHRDAEKGWAKQDGGFGGGDNDKKTFG